MSFGSGGLALGVTWIGLELIPSVTDFAQVRVTGGSTNRSSSLSGCPSLKPLKRQDSLSEVFSHPNHVHGQHGDVNRLFEEGGFVKGVRRSICRCLL